MDEKTSVEIASLAGRALDDPESITRDEIKKLAASCLTQAPAKGEQRGLDVKGYKPTQPDWAIEAVNVFKELEERTLRAAERLDGQAIDHRLLAIGKTQIQGAFMFLARAVFQPQRFALPEDDAEGLFNRTTPAEEVHDIAWALAKMDDGYKVRCSSWPVGEWITLGDSGVVLLDEEGAVYDMGANSLRSTDWELAE